MEPHRAVHRLAGLAEDGTQFARRGTAQLVHLEEALLPMKVAKRERQVGTIAGGDGRHAVRVARDRHPAV